MDCSRFSTMTYGHSASGRRAKTMRTVLLHVIADLSGRGAMCLSVAWIVSCSVIVLCLFEKMQKKYKKLDDALPLPFP